MAHPFAPDPAVRDLDTAAVANHSLVLHAAVLAAGALPVFLRAEDSLAEQTILFRSIGSIIDRFRLFYFSKGPASNIMRAGQADADSFMIIDTIVTCLDCSHSQA